MQSDLSFAQKTGIVTLAAAGLGALAGLVILATDFLLLLFLAILFGVFLTKVAMLVGRWTSLGYGWNLAIVVLLLLGSMTVSVLLFGASFQQQLDGLSKRLDDSVSRVETWLKDRPYLSSSIRQVPYVEDLLDIQSASQDQKQDKSAASSNAKEADGEKSQEKDDSNQQGDPSGSGDSGVSSDMIRQAAGRVFSVLKKMVGTTFGLLANLGVIFFVGLFLAVDPTLYRDGFARLFPPERRDRVAEVMDETAVSMFNWLNGRFLAMLITGAGTAIALALLGVPLPLTIGAITGLMTFIPNIGAVISLMLAMLMAVSQGPMTVVWVVVIYAGLQLIESNVVTPLIQQTKTSIPPALLLGFQLIMAALTGFLGVMVATPLLAAGMTLTEEVWIKDTLGDRSTTSGEE